MLWSYYRVHVTKIVDKIRQAESTEMKRFFSFEFEKKNCAVYLLLIVEGNKTWINFDFYILIIILLSINIQVNHELHCIYFFVFGFTGDS